MAKAWNLPFDERRQLVVEATQARLLLPERLDDLRVELLPRLSLDLGDRLVPAEGSSVRTIARHGVERVRDREHARPEWDLPAGETVRIAAPVPALVV
jgi:hypothetical protein